MQYFAILEVVFRFITHFRNTKKWVKYILADNSAEGTMGELIYSVLSCYLTCCHSYNGRTDRMGLLTYMENYVRLLSQASKVMTTVEFQN